MLLEDILWQLEATDTIEITHFLRETKTNQACLFRCVLLDSMDLGSDKAWIHVRIPKSPASFDNVGLNVWVLIVIFRQQNLHFIIGSFLTESLTHLIFINHCHTNQGFSILSTSKQLIIWNMDSWAKSCQNKQQIGNPILEFVDWTWYCQESTNLLIPNKHALHRCLFSISPLIINQAKTFIHLESNISKCHDWCQNTQNISYYSYKNRILSTIIFS